MTTIFLPANSVRAADGERRGDCGARGDAAGNAFVASERAGGIEGRLIGDARDFVDDGTVEDVGNDGKSETRGTAGWLREPAAAVVSSAVDRRSCFRFEVRAS